VAAPGLASCASNSSLNRIGEARDHDRPLNRQITPVPLRRAPGAEERPREIIDGRLLRLEQSRQRLARDPEPVLAGGALVARLHIKEARDGLSQARNARPVVIQNEPGRSEPRADELERRKISRNIDLLAGITRADTPDMAALNDLPSSGPPATS
jgi:hypothetical protein